MPSLDSIAMHSLRKQERGDLARMLFRTGQRRIARWVVLAWAFGIVGVMTGCGESGGPASPERKEKQEVVQDKMKEFMKQSKLPNRAR